MLRSLGRGEADSILAERGNIEITCDFCNARYAFDAVDVGQLFASGATQAADEALRH
jgi:molecular chaperone Hsp33